MRITCSCKVVDPIKVFSTRNSFFRSCQRPPTEDGRFEKRLRSRRISAEFICVPLLRGHASSRGQDEKEEDCVRDYSGYHAVKKEVMQLPVVIKDEL